MSFPNHEDWLEPYVPAIGELALDIGANTGEWTKLLSGRYGEVHSFDPNPQILAGLREYLLELKNVKLYELAIGSFCEMLPFNLFNVSQYASLDAGREGILETIEVSCLTLDSLGYAREPVDFIKIDTEGAEASVLTGARQTLLANHPKMIIEIHSFDQLSLCNDLLRDAEYDLIRHIPHPYHEVQMGHCWLAVTE